MFQFHVKDMHRPVLRNSAIEDISEHGRQGWIRSSLVLVPRDRLTKNQGLIYRNYRPVHYSPSSRSALAEAELVYRDDHVSHSVYIVFEVDRKLSNHNPVMQDLFSSSTSVRLLVWTTTPWTLTANMVGQSKCGFKLSISFYDLGYCSASRLAICSFTT